MLWHLKFDAGSFSAHDFDLQCAWHCPGQATHEKLWLRKYSQRPTQKQSPLVKVQRFYWNLDINRTSLTWAPTSSDVFNIFLQAVIDECGRRIARLDYKQPRGLIRKTTLNFQPMNTYEGSILNIQMVANFVSYFLLLLFIRLIFASKPVNYSIDNCLTWLFKRYCTNAITFAPFNSFALWENHAF